jgi:hypothetical protein
MTAEIPARPHALVDRRGRQTGSQQLITADHAALPLREAC